MRNGQLTFVVGVVSVVSGVIGCAADPNHDSGGADLDSGVMDATSAGGASSDSGGNGGTLDCSGAFGSPEVVRSESGFYLSSPSVTGDGLELFYVREDAASNTPRVVVIERTSRTAAFSEPTEVPELSVCTTGQVQSIDVTRDGLRMYWTCNDNQIGMSPLYRAARADRSSPFVRETTAIGNVGLSIDVTPDELGAFSAGTNSTDPVPQMYERTSVDAPFSAGTAVPGIDVAFLNPELSPDGLTLYGAINVNQSYALVASTRISKTASFSAPTSDGLPVPPDGMGDATPVLSADCRDLYFVRYPSAAATDTWTIQVVRR